MANFNKVLRLRCPHTRSNVDIYLFSDNPTPNHPNISPILKTPLLLTQIIDIPATLHNSDFSGIVHLKKTPPFS